jgi:hypothetical protein
MSMIEKYYPPGWDAARVKRLLDHYENMTDEEWVAEDEAARAIHADQLPILKRPKIEPDIDSGAADQ